VYWYDKSQAKLRTVRSLSSPSAYITLPNGTIAPSNLKVPLTDGASAPIPTPSNEEASLILDVYFGSFSDGGTHIQEIVCKGFNWADRMTFCPLPHDLAWKSFTHLLQPGTMWGIATMVMPPLKLLEQIQRVYFRCLPMLNVNCHINLPWQLIPEKYQGLGMANYALVSLSLKLPSIQCNWGFDNVDSRALMMGYKLFMVEVGLYGNTMDYDYKAYSILDTNNTWFKNV
jgi:hypothetical protein